MMLIRLLETAVPGEASVLIERPSWTDPASHRSSKDSSGKFGSRLELCRLSFSVCYSDPSPSVNVMWVKLPEIVGR